MGPVANVIGLPSVKKVAKVPPIAPATTEVPGANVRVPVGDGAVKESTPVAEKKPLMESAWATAAVLTAKAASTNRRLNMGISGVSGIRGKSSSHCPLGDALLSCFGWLEWKKITHLFFMT
jgi:hypothetical protein